MCKYLIYTIINLEKRIQKTDAFLKRAWFAVLLLVVQLFYSLGYVLLMIFRSPDQSFQSVNELDQDNGYHASYSDHMHQKNKARLGTAASVSVLIVFTVVIGTFLTNINLGLAASQVISCSGTLATPTAVVEADLAGDDVTFTDTGGDGYCELDEAISAASVVIGSGVVLSHANMDADGVTITTTGNITISGDIDADNDGCNGSGLSNGWAPDLITGLCENNEVGAGEGWNNGIKGAGGASHGGLGGDGTTNLNGDVYDSAVAPILFGSSGGQDWGNVGGSGGGIIRLDVGGNLINNGIVSVDGGDGIGSSGAGSGGSVYITVAGTAGGSGTYSANGGNAFDSNGLGGGGGGGGRIAITHQGASFTNSDFTVSGGTAVSGAAGAKGTVYTKNTATNAVDIFHGFSFDDTDHSVTTWNVDSSAENIYCDSVASTPTVSATTLNWAGTLNCNNGTLTSFGLAATGTFSLASGTTINIQDGDLDFTIPAGNNQTWTNLNVSLNSAKDFTIDDAVGITLAGTSTITGNTQWTNLTSLQMDNGTSINASGKGCTGGGYSHGYGPSDANNVCAHDTVGAGHGWNNGVEGAGGAGYGGNGGNGSTKTGGGVYGSNTAPVMYGSSGGRSWGTSGGAGGGYVRLDTSGTFTLNGAISVNGNNGQTNSSTASGAGSGGSIYITTNLITGTTGSLSADGGTGIDAPSYDSGGGGGGRISLSGADSTSFIAGYNAASVTTGGTAPGVGAANGANGTLYTNLTHAPNTPSITSPVIGYLNQSVNPTVTSAAYSSDGASHVSTDWKVATSADGSNAVWTKNTDTVNKTSIVVNDSNGAFIGALAGQTALANSTQYYLFVRHNNVVGNSNWSVNGHIFTTVSSNPGAVTTWPFTTAGNYTYNNSFMSVASGVASLDDFGGGTYKAPGMSGYNYRKTITLTNAGAELTNHQVLVNVTYDADMQADFDDLRFTSSDGITELDYWIESYVASTSAVAFVEVPVIAASTDTNIYMYYGNGGVSTTSNQVNTMINDYSTDANLLGQWLFDEGSGTSVADSTGNGHDGTITWDGTAAWYGADNFFGSGNAIDLDGVGEDRVDTNIQINTNLNNDFTLEAWAYVDESADPYSWFFGESTGTTFLFGKQSGIANLHYNISGIGSTSSVGLYTVPAWHHYVLTHDKSEVNAFKIYVDGVLTSTSSRQNLSPNSVGNIRFGRRQASEALDGKLDEMRVYTRYMTLEEVQAHTEHRKYGASTPSIAIGVETAVTDYSGIQVVNNTGASFENIQTFTEVLGGNNAGVIRYQISNNGTNWYYHNGSNWTAASIASSHNNPSSVINARLPNFVSDVGTGDFYFKAFLISNGTQPVELDSVAITSNTAPSASTVLYANNTTTTAQAGDTNPGNLTDSTPALSAIYNDSDVGDIANKWQVEVDTQADFAGTDMWLTDGSGLAMDNVIAGNRISDIEYGGSALSCGIPYYWRIKLWDDSNLAGTWSAAANFEINCTPTTSADSGSTNEDTQLVGDLSHTDGDSDAVTYSIVANASNGTAVITNTATGAFTYDPTNNYNGSDSFTYKVNDGTVDSNTSTYTITINPQNDVPTANAGVDQNVSEDDSVTLDGSGSADVDVGDTITYLWTETVDVYSACALSSTTVVNPSVTLDNRSANYPCTFSLVVNDGTIDSVADEVTINITADNDVPISNAGVNITVVEDTTTTLDGSASSDVDVDNTITYEWSEVADPNDGCSLNNPTNSNPTVTVNDLESNFNCTMSLTVNDGTEDSDTASVTINVTGLNDAPSITEVSDKSVQEGETLTFAVGAADIDTTTVTMAALDENGDFIEHAVDINDLFTDNNNKTGTFSWEPDSNTAGNYQVTFTASDGSTTTTEIVNVAVADGNNPPTFTGSLPNVSFIFEANNVFDLDEYFADEETAELTYSVSGNTAVEVSIEEGVVSFRAEESFTGSEELTFTATDDDGASEFSNTIVVTVTEADVDTVDKDNVGYMTGTARGAGIITIYDQDGNVLSSWTAFPKGGVIPEIATMNGNTYVFAVKKKTGSTIHVYDLNGNLKKKRRLSPNLHWRKLAIGKLDKNGDTQEIVVATTRGRSVYFKIYTFKPSQNKFGLLKRAYYRAKSGTSIKNIIRNNNYRVSVNNKAIKLTSKRGRQFFQWRPYKK